MGLTGLIATIMGMLGGVLPDVIKEIRDSRTASREIDHMRVQAELQLQAATATADSRLREVETNAYVAESAAFREQLRALVEAQARPTGIAWIDGFNAILRPVCVSVIMLLFIATAIPFVWAVLAQYRTGGINAVQMAQVIWGSLVGESIVAALGFLFGYRSAAKPTAKA